MNLTVLGAGAWGTALAISACTRHPTRLWTRDAEQAVQMRSMRRNTRYLGEAVLPQALQVTSDFDAAVAHAEGGLVVIGTPMSGLAEMLQRLSERAAALPGLAGVLWLC